MWSWPCISILSSFYIFTAEVLVNPNCWPNERICLLWVVPLFITIRRIDQTWVQYTPTVFTNDSNDRCNQTKSPFTNQPILEAALSNQNTTFWSIACDVNNDITHIDTWSTKTKLWCNTKLTQALTPNQTHLEPAPSCPAKLSKHQRTFNQLEEYQLWSWLPEFRRYLCTTSTMYCTWRCNCYLHTTSDQNDTVSSCQPILVFWKGDTCKQCYSFIVAVVDAKKSWWKA